MSIKSDLRPPPDFVIVGAPKCGTTSLASALGLHQGVSFSCIKEPHYFALDYPNRREVENFSDYDRLFVGATASDLRGEASTSYLFSREAVPAILRQRPDAKIIAMVRNPLDMFVSWHNELVKSWDEDQLSPERAWRLQQERSAGRMIPRYCKQPEFLQYQTVCSLGTQIQRLFELVPEPQRLVLVLDDLDANPDAEYRSVLQFLNLECNPGETFSHENSYSQFDSILIPRLSYSILTSPRLKKVRARLTPLFTRYQVRPLRWLTRRGTRQVQKPVLSDSFREELMEVFQPEVRSLETLLNRDFSHWIAPPMAQSKATVAC
jgi:hypothetical protein